MPAEATYNMMIAETQVHIRLEADPASSKRVSTTPA